MYISFAVDSRLVLFRVFDKECPLGVEEVLRSARSYDKSQQEMLEHERCRYGILVPS